MKVEAQVEHDAAVMANGKPEVHIRVLYDDGEIDPSTWPGQCRKLPKQAVDLLPQWAQRLAFEYSIAFYPDFFGEDHDTDPEHDFDHEDWYIFRAADLEG